MCNTLRSWYGAGGVGVKGQSYFYFLFYIVLTADVDGIGLAPHLAIRASRTVSDPERDCHAGSDPGKRHLVAPAACGASVVPALQTQGSVEWETQPFQRPI